MANNDIPNTNNNIKIAKYFMYFLNCFFIIVKINNPTQVAKISKNNTSQKLNLSSHDKYKKFKKVSMPNIIPKKPIKNNLKLKYFLFCFIKNDPEHAYPP